MALSIGCPICVEARAGLKTKNSDLPPKIRCRECDKGMPWDEPRAKRSGDARERPPLSEDTGWRHIPIAYTRR